jgi:ATP diphosphatase
MHPSKDISRLIEIMAALRTPVSGCPWDLEQDFSSIAPYTIEEAYEVADAIERGDMDELKDELGDLLLQVVYHARMAEEQGLFEFSDIVEAVTAKMIRRHPHVFGDADARSARAVKGIWERIKAEERAGKKSTIRNGASDSVLDGVPIALPALARALKLQQKASRVGFDWDESGQVLEKVAEEISELRSARNSGDRDATEDEFGDLLFSLVNYARHCGIDPEKALRRTNDKFRNRFGHIENALARRGSSIEGSSLTEMEELWQQAKLAVRK